MALSDTLQRGLSIQAEDQLGQGGAAVVVTPGSTATGGDTASSGVDTVFALGKGMAWIQCHTMPHIIIRIIT